jgi:hypothetical protein
MSESVVDAADVEETVTQEHVEIQLDQGSLNKWHNFLRRTLRDVFDAAGPIFCFLPVLTFCLTYYQL